MRFAGFVSLSFVVAACSSSPTGSASAGGNSGVGDASGGATGAAARCDPGPGYGMTTEPRQVDSVSATLVDLDGQPVADEVVQVCGTDICVAGTSTATGGVVIGPAQKMRKPAFKFGEGKISAKFAWLLPDDEREVDFGTVHTARLPPLDTGVALVPGDSASSGGLSVSVPAGGHVKIDKLTFGDPAEQTLRAVVVPIEQAPGLVDPELGIELLYAATPVDTVFCPPAALSVDNVLGWDPGTDVEVLLHGVDIEEEWAPYGGFAKVSDARVSDDGARIETTSPGLPVLGVLGFRRR